ncbi:hypothetical protein Y017_11520 [Alcanivorax sp. 97CO-5]|uniref:mitochondrial fission ELM1 family protein n=1 Tax=unclassified Alcanivorax TaxID=2638842 RepID=UPI0003E7DE62|nr:MULTISPECIES: mitochondrial fission ELM1 family protein [unclassified Alcanivorax]EUC70040.1 hypothetical protein Y017_11520 [Alcanivorax sp. 97CO-5]
MGASSTKTSFLESATVDAAVSWPGQAFFDSSLSGAVLDPQWRVRSLVRPVIWLLNDGKAGHVNQLRGLGERLEALCGAQLVWLSCKDFRVTPWQAMAGQPPEIAAPTPDIIIAAGSGTHALLLACRRQYGAMTVVLMRPGFPLGWAHLKVIPEHDNPPARGDILATQGAITAVRPNPGLTEQLRGLILVGGDSPHFCWDSDAIYQQLMTLSQDYPHWQWTVTSSRRTPLALVEKLQRIERGNVQFFHHQQTDAGWLPDQLKQSRVAWVSPDSVSMLYESLTAGVLTGMFALQPGKKKRVVKGVLQLHQRGLISAWNQRDALMESDEARPLHLWEANRVAHWLIERYQEADF